MKPLAMFSGVLASMLFLLAVSSEPAYAYAGTNPNIIRMMNSPNFRRPIGENARYRYNKRRIEASDSFTTASGSNSTFDRRADYLRATQLKRIQEDLDARQFSGERRSTKTYYERENRSADTSLRRINEAQRRGGIRLRRGTSSLRQLQGLTSEEKRQRLLDYRQHIKEAETNRFRYDNTNCAALIGRRQAQCWYERRTD